MAKTKIVKFMCSIVLAVSLVLSQSYTAMASGSSTITGASQSLCKPPN